MLKNKVRTAHLFYFNSDFKMKVLLIVFLILFVGLQYRLWVGEGSLAHRHELEKKIEQQQAENEVLRERNRILGLEVEALKNGLDAVEERAREEMGMIREGETFFMIVEPDQAEKQN